MKKLLIALALMGVMVSGLNAADTALKDMTAITSPAGTDIMYVVANPGTTPVDRQITFTSLLGIFQPILTRPMTGPASPTANNIVKYTGTGQGTDNAGLIIGTLTNTYLCTYTTSGTLLDCNTNPATFQTALTRPMTGPASPTANNLVKYTGTGQATDNTAVILGTMTDGKLCTYASSGTLLSCTTDTSGSCTGNLCAVTASANGLTILGDTYAQMLGHIGAMPAGWIVQAGANNVLTYTGNFSLGVTLTGNTTVTLPTSGTLLTTAGTAAAASNLIFTSDARGDIPIRGATVYGRLAKGGAAYTFLRMNSGNTDPEWSTATIDDSTSNVTKIANGSSSLQIKSGQALNFTGTFTDGKLCNYTSSGSVVGCNVTPGAGDVVGPSGATDGAVALFDTTTGKLLKDGGAPPWAAGSDGNYGISVKNNTSTTATASGYDGVFALVANLPVFKIGAGSVTSILYSGGAAGTPSSITLTNGTGLPTTGLVGHAITTTSLTAGRPYYVSAADTYTAADATSAATLPSPAICVAISTTVCQVSGTYTTTGLTAGAVYYVPVGVGALTATPPSGSGNQIQRVGVARSTTVLQIMPSLDVATVQ